MSEPLKLRGFGFEVIFLSLISLPFLGLKTVNSLINNMLAIHIEARKDTY